jgi:D-tyrosyl-tRNA(Tyr) deacylase
MMALKHPHHLPLMTATAATVSDRTGVPAARLFTEAAPHCRVTALPRTAAPVIALIQRVLSASVNVDNETVGAIDAGLLALVAVQPDDGEAQAKRMLERLLGYRVFSDEAGKMNRSLTDTGGGLLLVSQFTLAADTRSGMRPSFTSAASPEHGRIWFERLVELARAAHPRVEIGRFGAHMQVHLVNDGPVTFWLEVR